jgi:hypothetical protein
VTFLSRGQFKVLLETRARARSYETTEEKIVTRPDTGYSPLGREHLYPGDKVQSEVPRIAARGAGRVVAILPDMERAEEARVRWKDGTATVEALNTLTKIRTTD